MLHMRQQKVNDIESAHTTGPDTSIKAPVTLIVKLDRMLNHNRFVSMDCIVAVAVNSRGHSA